MAKVYGLTFLTSFLMGTCVVLRIRTGSILFTALVGGLCGTSIALAYIWGAKDG